MTKIQLHPNFCRIEDEPDTHFLWALDRELSFKVQGAEHTSAYRGYFNRDGEFIKWDGFKRLLSEALQFPTGLLQRVINFYNKDDRQIELVDCRPPKSPTAKIDILSTLQSQNKNPYYYQIDAANATLNHDCGILRMATGAGKSVTMALMTANFGKRTIVYVIGTDLLYQLHGLFSSLFDQKIGIVGDGLCDLQEITVASVWTIGQALGLKNKIILDEDDEKTCQPEKYKLIREFISTVKVHIFDECHLAACETIQEINRNINPEHIYGMSASPWRDDGQDMMIECILGRNIVNISASKLISEGFLVKPIIKFIKVPPPVEKIKKNYQTIYKNYIVENPIRNGLILKAANKLIEQKYPTLVLFQTISHGQFLYEELKKSVPCAVLSGKDDAETRNKVKKQLEDGEIKCILASRIYEIGVDLPTLSGLVCAGSGKSSVRALQRIGRVIRKFPGKKQAAIVDFVDSVPFLYDHSKQRRLIYSSEEGFDVTWPSK